MLRFANVLTPKPRTRKVLIIEPFGLGDMISLEPLVRTLRERDYEVALCGKKEWRALYPEDRQIKWINAELPWVNYDENRKYALKEYCGVEFRNSLRQLRSYGRGALGVDTRGDIRSVGLLYLAGCNRVLTLENYLGSNLTIIPGTGERLAFHHNLRRWELNLTFLGRIEPGLRHESITGPSFRHFASSQNSRQKLVGLVPVAPWPGKWWQPEKWEKLIKEFRAKGMDVLGLCGPNQGREAQGELQPSVTIKECHSIENWAVALSQCSLVVAVDSGPMHLADALGIPTVALFGQGKLPLWAPSNAQSCAISHQMDPDFELCQPVARNTGLGREFMNRISVSEVTAAVQRVSLDFG